MKAMYMMKGEVVEERESGTSPSDIEYANERHVRRSSDRDRQGRNDFVVAGATGQGEAAIELEMREGAPSTSARSTLYRDPGSQSDYTRIWARSRCPTYSKITSRSHQEPAQGPSPCARPSPSATRDAAVIRGSEFSLKTRITSSITHINANTAI